jgi:hypothetical protein
MNQELRRKKKRIKEGTITRPDTGDWRADRRKTDQETRKTGNSSRLSDCGF